MRRTNMTGYYWLWFQIDKYVDLELTKGTVLYKMLCGVATSI